MEKIKSILMRQANIYIIMASYVFLMSENSENSTIQKLIVKDMQRLLNEKNDTGKPIVLSPESEDEYERFAIGITQMSGLHLYHAVQELLEALNALTVPLTAQDKADVQALNDIAKVLADAQNVIGATCDNLMPNYVTMYNINEPWLAFNDTIAFLKKIADTVLTDSTRH